MTFTSSYQIANDTTQLAASRLSKDECLIFANGLWSKSQNSDRPTIMHNRAFKLTKPIPLTFFLFALLGLLCLLQEGACAQEAPYFTAPKFSRTTGTFRTDLCDRMRRVYYDEGDNNKLDLPNALEGLNLSVVLTNYEAKGSMKPFFSLNDDGVIDEEQPGLFAIVLDEVANRAGFSWRNSFGVVNQIDPATDGNRTWTDLLEWQTKMYDITAGKWGRTLERLEMGMGFPEGYFDASMILVQSTQTSENVELWNFLLPFDWQVWLLIVATVILTGLVYVWLDYMNSTTSTSADPKALEKPGAAVYHGFIAMTGNFDYQPNSAATRVLSFSLTFFALLVGAAYTANLVSFLVIRNTPNNEIGSLHDAVLLGVPICVEGRTAADRFVSTKYPRANLKRKETEEDVFLALQEKGNNECKVAAVARGSYELYRHSRLVNQNCSLYWNGYVDDFSPSAGLVTAIQSGNYCSSLLFNVLDYHLVAMKSDGTLERMWNSFLDSIGDQECINSQDLVNVEDDDLYSNGDEFAGGKRTSRSTNNEKSLTVKELAGVFIVHGALSTLAIVLALVTYFYKKRFGARRQQQEDIKKDENTQELDINKDMAVETVSDFRMENGIDAYGDERIHEHWQC